MGCSHTIIPASEAHLFACPGSRIGSRVRWIRGKNCDVAILVSGDTDFADALQEVKDCGVSVEVALFGPRYSSQRLRDVADEVIVIDGSYLAGSWV